MQFLNDLIEQESQRWTTPGGGQVSPLHNDVSDGTDFALDDTRPHPWHTLTVRQSTGSACPRAGDI